MSSPATSGRCPPHPQRSKKKGRMGYLAYADTPCPPHLIPGLNRLDLEMEEQGILEVKHSIPYADITDLPKERLEQMIKDNHPLEFGHRLEDQIQGQIDAGFVVTGFYEDNLNGKSLLDNYINTTIATKAVKLRV